MFNYKAPDFANISGQARNEVSCPGSRTRLFRDAFCPEIQQNTVSCIFHGIKSSYDNVLSTNLYFLWICIDFQCWVEVGKSISETPKS